MANQWFRFKQFKIFQDRTAMKVGVDGVLLGAVSHFENSKNILDIGAGTGLIALMAAQKTDAKITAVEIDKNAFLQCRENVRFNGQSRRIEVVNSSFQEFYVKIKKKFDFIISNPPYFENSLKSKINTRNTARHSDLLSKEELVKGAAKILSVQGIFSVILPAEFESNFEEICNKNNLFCNYKMYIKPKQNKAVNRIIFEFSAVKKNFLTETLIIRDTYTNQYTKAYKELTKDLYLHF